MGYIAVLVDIKEVRVLPPEFLPYVEIKANQEERELDGSEKVAILNISGTSSYSSVFLDKGKTIEEIKAEVLKDTGAKMNYDAVVAVRNAIH
ncbi:MAG: DUF749 family protein [Candidatus Hydrothermarchaeaceae archaeon]